MTTTVTTDATGTHGNNGYKRAQDHLLSRRKARKRLKSTANHAPEPVRIRKVEGSIPFVSTICKASGYTACLAFVSMARSVSPPGPFDSSGSPSRYRA